MKIEHAAIYVCDLERARAFFETWFGARSGDKYVNPKKGFASYFLSFDDGARLEIMTKEGISDPVSDTALGYAHLSFSLGSAAAVDDMTAHLKAAGYEVTSGPRTTGDGYYESCILDAEGNQIELTV